MRVERPSWRIAVRAEGKMVNAYWTRFDTMDGAELVASISRELCDAEPEAFEAFKLMMECASVSLAKIKLGKKVTRVDVLEAPEHEKAGQG